MLGKVLRGQYNWQANYDRPSAIFPQLLLLLLPLLSSDDRSLELREFILGAAFNVSGFSYKCQRR